MDALHSLYHTAFGLGEVGHISDLWHQTLRRITYRLKLRKHAQNLSARTSATLTYVVSSLGGSKGIKPETFLPWPELVLQHTRHAVLSNCSDEALRELHIAIGSRKIVGMGRLVYLKALGELY